MPRRGLRRLLRVPRPARQQASEELRAEFELHLELRAAELEAEGLSSEEARREALRLFGDPERARREMLRSATRHVREQRGREAMGDMSRDVRYAARSLVRSPGFTLLALMTLAVGIGANTAMYSVVDAVLLEPLPLPAPERVAGIWEARSEGDRNVVNPANFVDWRERSASFDAMAGLMTVPMTLMAAEGAREVQVQLAHPELFEVLGTPPAHGRTFMLEEAAGAPGTARVVVLTNGFWRSHFGGDPAVIGTTLELTSGRVEVVGVMGPELDFFAGDVAFWLPTDFAWGNRTSMGRFLRVVGRLAPGSSMESAGSELRTIAATLREAHPAFNEGWSATVVPLDEQLKGDVRPALVVLLAAVGLLLLVTCVNMANLLLVRAAGRRTEIALRASLGAGRGRIARELLTESLLLSIVGGALGVALAYVATRALVTALPASLRVPRLDQVSVDPGVLAFAALLAVGTGVIFGLAPVFDAFRTDLIGQLREGGRGGGGVRARRLRAGVVVGEVALSLVLLIGAGLLLRSFMELQRTDLGLRTENLLTARANLQGPRYQDGESRSAFLRRAIGSVGAVAGARSVGAISWLPLTGQWTGHGYYLPGQARSTNADQLPSEVQAVSGAAFDALGIPLVRGRLFTPADDAAGTLVVIVNEALAAQAWPAADPIGQRIIVPWGGEEEELEVVGVVGNVRQRGVDLGGQPALYRPYAQFPAFGSMSLLVRTATEAAGLSREVVRRVREVDPTVAVADVRTMEEVVSGAIARPRFTSVLVSGFAGMALLLAALGIYGLLAYTVSQRSRELSIRQALGARAGQVARLVLREALLLGLAGVALGVLAAAGATRLLESQLYQVTPWDPWVFVGMPALLLAITVAAAAVPARRAARVEAGLAVREE